MKKLGCLVVGVVLIALGAAGTWYYMRGRPNAGPTADGRGSTAGTWQALTPSWRAARPPA